MNKLQFLNQLRVKLEILSDKEIKDILDEYSDTIDQKIQEGKTEEEAVKDFGDINELAQEILQAYKIDPNKKSRNSSDLADKIGQIITDIVDYLVTFFSTIFKDLSVEGFTRVMVLIGVGLVLIILLKIPFVLIERLIETVFHLILPYFLARPLSLLVNIFLGFSHVFISFMLIISFIRIGISGEDLNYKNLVTKPLSDGFKFTKNERKESSETMTEDKKNAENVEEKKNDDVSSEKEVEIEKVVKEKVNKGESKKEKGNNIFVTVFIWIIRFCAFLFLLPFWVMIICAAVGIGIGIFLLFQGFKIWGLVLMAIGGLGLLSATVTFISNILWYMKKTNFKALMVQVVLSSIILGVGVVVSVDEFANAKFVKIDSQNVEEYLDTKLFTATTDLIPNKKYLFHNDTIFEADNSLTNEIVMEALLPVNSYVYFEEYDENAIYANIYSRGGVNEGQEFFKLIYNGMKNNEFYQYEYRDFKVKVRVPADVYDDLTFENNWFIYEK